LTAQKTIDGAPAESATRTVSLAHLGWIEAVLLLCIPGSIGLALAGMVYTGAFSNILMDPGPLTTRGLPVVRVVHDISASLTIGFLVLASVALPGQKNVAGVVSYTQWSATRWAARSAAVWAATAIAGLFLTASNAMGPVPSSVFTTQFVFFATELELGQSLVASIVCILIAFVTLLLSKRVSWVAFATVMSILALLPLSLSGHAAGSDEHGNAVNSLAIHLIGVTVWAGGLTALILLRRRLKTALPVVVARYSVLAGWAFVAVAVSGTINAMLRLASPSDLLGGYGLLILIKIVVLVLLGLAGIWHRRRIIPQLVRQPERGSLFARLATAEVVLMAVAMGVSVALSRSAPPVSQEPVGPGDTRRGLLGFPFPEPVDAWRMLTSIHVDWLFLSAGVILACLYIAAVLRLRRRGDAWPVMRTVSWLAGCVGLIYTTSGGPGVYGAVHFSTHMIQHMGLMMFVPPLLVLGGPILLALRTLPKRHDASRGPREWILIVVHSRYLRVLSYPAVAGVIFAGSLVVFYYTDWFQYSLQTHQGHILMCFHFLASGYLFFWVLIGVDPGPARPSYPLRLILLLATLAFHAFFGLAIMSASDVLAIDWWHALGYTDTAALLADQQVGGGIAWGAGELPVVLVALMVVRQWVVSDERTAKRTDRTAERDDDAELRAYNERLMKIDDRDRRAGA
jgi:cytochrome c oxidase assembly factor CtaG/putative copper export protein